MSTQFPLEGIENLVIKVLIEKKESTELGNNMVMILNRGEQLFQLTLASEDSFIIKPALRLLNGMFKQTFSSDFFFVNDLNVLIDVIIRGVNNLAPGDLVSLFFNSSRLVLNGWESLKAFG